MRSEERGTTAATPKEMNPQCDQTTKLCSADRSYTHPSVVLAGNKCFPVQVIIGEGMQVS
jgi:hypothetical protein